MNVIDALLESLDRFSTLVQANSALLQGVLAERGAAVHVPGAGNPAGLREQAARLQLIIEELERVRRALLPHVEPQPPGEEIPGDEEQR